jgi:TonB family protein
MLEETRPRLLVNWQREDVRARARESGLAALVLHLALVIMILISPRFFYATPLVAAEAEPDLTVLYLPSDVVPVPESRTPSDLTPEERRRAVVHSPLTLDPRELERILRPAVPLTEPSLPGGPGQPAFPGDELEARRRTPYESRDSETDSSRREIARLENVPEFDRRPRSGLELPQTTPGRAIQESLRRSQGAAGRAPGAGGQDLGTIEPNFNTPYPTILSDTRGVDFTSYLVRLVREVRRNWYLVIPDSARLGEQGRVIIVFTVEKDGAVPRGQPIIVSSSGRSHLDRPALGAIRGAQPFPPLPPQFDGPNIVLQFTFLYNLPIDYTGP